MSSIEKMMNYSAGLKLCNAEFIIDNTKLRIKAHRNPSTLNPGTKFAAKRIKNAFITNVKSPSVIMLIGKVNSSRIGFKIALIIPITRAAMRAAVKLCTCTPGKIYAAAKTANPLKIQLIKMPIFISIPLSC